MNRSSEARENLVQNLKKFFPMADLNEILETNKLVIDGNKRIQKFLREGKLDWLKKSGIKRLEFSRCSYLKKRDVAFLEEMDSLEGIMFDKCRVHPDVLGVVASLDTLTLFTIQDTQLPEWTFEVFRDNKHLKTMNINGCFKYAKDIQDVILSMTGLEELSLIPFVENANQFLNKLCTALPNLKTLALGPDIRLGVSGCEALASMKSLDMLVLINLMETPDMTLKFLEEMPQLKGLFIVGCPLMEDFDVQLPSLEKLTLASNPNLSRLDFALYPNLKKLELDGDLQSPQEESQEIELKDLDSASALKELKLSCLNLTSEDFRALEMLMNLETIDLHLVPVEDEDLHFLGGSTALKKLFLINQNSPSAEALCELGYMPSLETLFIQNAEFLAGSGMPFVRNMPKLKRLALLGCKLTDEDMRGLTAANKLESLGLNDCSKVTDRGLACLNEMKELRGVRLANCSAQNWEIREVPHLRTLYLEEFRTLANLQISDLPELKLIPICRAGLRTLTLTNLPELNSLAVEQCPALNFLKMGGIPCLDHFDVIGSEQLDLTGLRAMKNVRSVTMAHTQLRQEGVLDSLRDMPNLEWLNVANRLDLEIMTKIDQKRQNNQDEFELEFILEDSTEVDFDESFRPTFTTDEEEAIRKALPNCEVSFSVHFK